MNRRQFFKTLGGTCFLSVPGVSGVLTDLYAFEDKANLSRVEARFYTKLEDREIECFLCPRECKLGDKERGYCGVRENIGGTYYTLVYGKACSLNVDPIEKKPFFHFLPGQSALSIATAGCNVNCKFCQNWEISQVRPEQIRHIDLPPASVAANAKKYNSPVIAYTYSEPVVFYEYMYDTSKEARKRGIRNVVITGGHITPDPLKELIKVVDGIKVDLKAFSQDFYTKYVRGELQPVLDAIKIIAKSNIWMEIVYLVIPTLNDSREEIQDMCRWIKSEIGPDIPVHFSRFYPMYLMKNLPPTPISTLEKAYEIALEEGLHYSYIGNVPDHRAESTHCPKCHKTVIRRRGYRIEKIELIAGKCRFCKNPIPGVWS
ncbi:MAG: AmmeMemoRadiSam system radical SAM enzyme [Candidatus Aminicenantes bacterium]|jgi:pyruvate formate lyase activating enzyme